MGEARDRHPRVLVFEDDGDVATLIVEILTSEGFDARRADHEASPDTIMLERPKLMLMDLSLGRRRGADVLAALRRSGVTAPVVLLSGKPDLESQAEALGAAAAVSKPFEIDALVATCWSVAG
jgi:two-component system OmpR family response regulator